MSECSHFHECSEFMVIWLRSHKSSGRLGKYSSIHALMFKVIPHGGSASPLINGLINRIWELAQIWKLDKGLEYFIGVAASTLIGWPPIFPRGTLCPLKHVHHFGVAHWHWYSLPEWLQICCYLASLILGSYYSHDYQWAQFLASPLLIYFGLERVTINELFFFLFFFNFCRA